MTLLSTKCSLAALAAAAVCAAPAQADPPQMRPPAPSAPARAIARVEAPSSGVLTLPTRCRASSQMQLRTRMSIRWPRTGVCVHGSSVRFRLGRDVARRLARHSTRAVLTVDGASRTFELGAAGAVARAADVSDGSVSWTDATLDCYPWTGGRLGGGTNNTSVHLSVLWKFPTWTWVAWQVQLEMYYNGTHLWQWDYPTATNHWWGPYTAGPEGIWELSAPGYTFTGSGSARQYNPWSEEFTFSGRVVVRAWVGLATYSNGWSQTTWHPARALHPAYGYSNGYCAI